MRVENQAAIPQQPIYGPETQSQSRISEAVKLMKEFNLDVVRLNHTMNVATTPGQKWVAVGIGLLRQHQYEKAMAALGFPSPIPSVINSKEG